MECFTILLQNALCRFRFLDYGFYALTYGTSLGRVLAPLVTFLLRDVAGMSPGCRRKALKPATEEGCFQFGGALAAFRGKKFKTCAFFAKIRFFPE